MIWQQMSLEERFWAQVELIPEHSCWEWAGSIRTTEGYGGIKLNRKSLLAHRVSWELHYGPIPDGLCVLHRCDNPSCVRPDHLFLGTIKDNAVDMQAKGRCDIGKAVAGRVRQMKANDIAKCGHQFTATTPAGSRYCQPCTRARWRGYYYAGKT